MAKFGCLYSFQFDGENQYRKNHMTIKDAYIGGLSMNKSTTPHPDWPWTLREGDVKRREFTPDDIRLSLVTLYTYGGDSFVVLRQEEPGNDKHYWYIQSAIALQGPHKDEYIVGIGWNDGTKAVYLERLFQWPDLNIVIDMFQQAFQRRALDLSGFEVPSYLPS